GLALLRGFFLLGFFLLHFLLGLGLFLLGGLALGLAGGGQVALEDGLPARVIVGQALGGLGDPDVLLGRDAVHLAVAGEPGAEDLGADADLGAVVLLVLELPGVDGATRDQDVEDGRWVDRGLDEPGVLGGDDRL